MRIGVAIEESWRFFQDVYDYLAVSHQLALFKRRTISWPIFNVRINRALFHRDLQAFVRSNDVVFFEWAGDLLAAATYLPKQRPYVVRLHRHELYDSADCVNWNCVDRVILVSQAMRAKFVARFPDQASKTLVIPVGVSLTKFRPGCRRFEGRIGTLCDLKPRKRVYDLILAYYELHQVQPTLRLIIGGGRHPAHGDYYESLQYLVQRLGLSDSVDFQGNITNAPAWFQGIDIFVSHSYSEGLQVAPMEAMASGCYCLSHHWDGADELVSPDQLYFTNSELIQKILAYCDLTEAARREEQQKMRTLACERFDLEVTKQQIRVAIEEFGLGNARADSRS